MARQKRVLRPRVEISEPRRPRYSDDPISNLPQDVLDIILSKLPFPDAVRTSILSYSWKYKWLSMSSLVCDWSSIWDSHGATVTDHAVSRTIGNFVINQHGPGIERFALKITSDTIYSDICLWLNFLIGKGIKEFIFEECYYVFFRVPDSLFAFEHLTTLRLIGCSLKLPSWFEKFNFITDLYLRKVSISNECIERLICSCSCLERLTLLRLQDLTTVRIQGPALKYLCMDSGSVETVIEDSPLLATVEITLSPSSIGCTEGLTYWVSLFRSLSGLQSLEELRLCGPLLELWATEIPLHEIDLKNENPVALYFDDVIMDNTILLKLCHFLLCCFPHAERFYFSVIKAKGYRDLFPFFADAKKSLTLFNNLKSVTMRYTNPVGAAADFLNFVVSRSPEIELVTLIRDGHDQNADRTVENIFKKLSQSAPNVMIVFKSEGSARPSMVSRMRNFPHYS